MRKECNAMNPNSALSAWQLAVMAAVPVAALAVWLAAIFLAAGATAAGAGSAHVAPGSVAGEDEPARPADDPIAA
jgi:hypothetical protein